MDISIALDAADLARPTLTHFEPSQRGKQIVLRPNNSLYAYATADEAYDIAVAWFDLATEMRRRWPHLYGTLIDEAIDLIEPDHAPLADLDDPGELDDYLASFERMVA